MWVGSVPGLSATVRLAASDPPIATSGSIVSMRLASIAAASESVQKLLVAVRPPNAEPLLLAALEKA